MRFIDVDQRAETISNTGSPCDKQYAGMFSRLRQIAFVALAMASRLRHGRTTNLVIDQAVNPIALRLFAQLGAGWQLPKLVVVSGISTSLMAVQCAPVVSCSMLLLFGLSVLTISLSGVGALHHSNPLAAG